METSGTGAWSCRYDVISADRITPDGATVLEVAANIPECMTPGPTFVFTWTDGKGRESQHVGRYVGALGTNYFYVVEPFSRTGAP